MPVQAVWKFSGAFICLIAAGLYMAEGVDLIRDSREEKLDDEIRKMSQTTVPDGNRSASGGDESSGFA